MLVFDDAAADFEVGHHLEGVHDGGDAAAGAVDELADLGEEGGEAVRLRFGRGAGAANGGWLFHELFPPMEPPACLYISPSLKR